MQSDNPENYIQPLTFPQTLEARMQFDPGFIKDMLAYNTVLLGRATNPAEIAELTSSDVYLKGLLERLEF